MELKKTWLIQKPLKNASFNKSQVMAIATPSEHKE